MSSCRWRDTKPDASDFSRFTGLWKIWLFNCKLYFYSPYMLSLQILLRRKNDQLSGETVNLIWQPANCAKANHTGVRLALVSMGSDTGRGQPVTHKMLTSPTLLSFSPSLLGNYSSLKYVCTVCICMYVQNLTIELEHINQKRWAIPHCVLASCIMSAGFSEINQVPVSFSDKSHCESMVKLSEDGAPTWWNFRLDDAWHQPSLSSYISKTIGNIVMALNSWIFCIHQAFCRTLTP